MTRRAWLMLGWGIVILVLVDGVMLSFDPQYEPSHADDKSNDDKKRAYGPVLPIVLGTIAYTEKFIETHEKLLIVLSTIAIAAFTGTLYRATSGLQNLAAKQAKDMRTSLRIAARTTKAAAKSAKAAEDTVESMERTARMQLRAYVSVKGGTIKFERNNTRPVAEVQITNFGKTPAYNLRSWIHIWIAEHPLSTTLPIPADDFAKSDSVLAPGNSTFMDIPKEPPVPPEHVALLGTREGTIYVYGRVEYRDAFHEPRWANYRLIYGGPEPMHGENLKTDSAGNDTSES